VIFGLVMTFVGPAPGGWWASVQSNLPGLRHGIYAVVGALGCSVLLALYIRQFLPKVPFFNRIILTATTGNNASVVPGSGPHGIKAHDAWPFVGTVGRALTDLRPGGTAEFPFADITRSTAVVSRSGYVTAGAKVMVEEVRGNRVTVRAVTATPSPASGAPSAPQGPA